MRAVRPCSKHLITHLVCQRIRRQSRRMDPKDQAVSLLNKIWAKLQGLPNSSPIELGAFLILLTFIAVFLIMMVVTCASCCCCCCRKARRKGADI
nr:small integral membrane protein 5 [Nerophis lumbriciformis]